MNFGDKIKAVRKKLFYSQTHLAEELGVSFSTVNRWENGKCSPNYDAQKAFYDLCEKNGIKFEE